MMPLALSANALAKSQQVSSARINNIVGEIRSFAPDIGPRFSRHFGGDAQPWFDPQRAYYLKVAQKAA